jgi:small ligand-binding sensory domain FIST
VQWATALSTATDLDQAFAQARASLEAQLGGTAPDLVLAFGSGAYGNALGELPDAIRKRWPQARVIGGSAGGVLAQGREVENDAGLSLTAAVLPGVELRSFHLHPDGRVGPEHPAWVELLRIEDDPHFVLLPDPFSFDPVPLLRDLDAAFPHRTKIGGLLSGSRQRGETFVFVDEAVHRSGAACLSLGGNVKVDSVVCQGCRPIGTPMFVTRVQGNMVVELDGQRPADVVRSLWDQGPPADRALLETALFLGVVMKPQREFYRQGDFLVRNIVGLEPNSGALAVAADIEPNSVVQFHVRDAETSAADIEAMLGAYARDAGHTPAGALLFSCLGRGEGLYKKPDHDSQAFARIIGPVPLGGFFCNGELGPVQETTHLHGYTSVFGLFSPKTSN